MINKINNANITLNNMNTQNNAIDNPNNIFKI